MEKVYSETCALRACDCDMGGLWRLSAVMEAMQETAATHSDRLGIGRDALMALGVVWILSRSRVTLDRTPRMGETVTVQTWPLMPRHMFYARNNAFLDAAGRRIGEATSLWVLMDIQTRRIVNRDEIPRHIPDNSDLPAAAPMGPIRPLPGEPEVRTLIPPYADFDVNGHVNNTKYLDWACNALGHGALAQSRVSAFSICYDAEVLPDMALRTELVRQGDQFSFCGYDGSKRCFCVEGMLEARR